MKKSNTTKTKTKWITAFLVTLAISSTAFAESNKLTPTEVGFLAGYDAFLKGSASTCAYELESVKDHFEQLPSAIANRARLYHLYCNAKLGYRMYAASLLQEVDRTRLSPTDRRTFLKIQYQLSRELEELERAHFWVFPYAGVGSFSAGSLDQSSWLAGTYGGIRYSDWDFGIGVESYNLNLSTLSTPYSQVLFNASVAKAISKTVSLRTYFTSITASGTGANAATVFSVGSSVSLLPTLILDVDANYSLYPSLSLGNTSVFQGTVSLNQTLVKTKSVSVQLQAASETILPKAQLQTDPFSGFTLSSIYQRWALGVVTNFGALQVGLTGWTGSEAFGVRNQGALVFNAMKNFHYGYGMSATYSFSPTVSTRVMVNREAYSVTTPTFVMTSFVGGFVLNL